MNQTVRKLLDGKADNHMLPFFWQHGEDEAVLRKYMEVMDNANCHAVCVESRPHPDFAGDKWWRDMDVILDEARKRNMKVWILDDRCFPTGFANGALKDQPDEMFKQNIYQNKMVLDDQTGPIDLRKAGLLDLSHLDLPKYERVFDDDKIVYVTAIDENENALDLTDCVKGDILEFEKPAGKWTLYVGICSRNLGGRRDYVCLTEASGVKLQIDAVYEKHWQHYADDFGKTIVGFFSDEPEIGNGKTYARGNLLGTDQDLPWSPNIVAAVTEALGENWRTLLPLLWVDGKEAPRVRVLYMDCVTKLVRKEFSYGIGDWCREHGVEYIGHIIEDGGQHCRTGSTLGHYFRGLQGQDMSGIDNIGGQVLAQGEDDTQNYFDPTKNDREGEFYHYALAKLAQSAAAIEPPKKGRAMCEIFGNYGWKEGVRMEKYQADHFLVRGINHFVPHAFTPKDYPDGACPPHFYAHGHHPQYRHFGEICGYMNRVSTLTSSGKHTVPVAVLYHGESEWADNDAMPFEKPLRALYDTQIDCHVIPADVFSEAEFYQTKIGNPLTVNGQKYHAFVVPQTKALSAAAVKGLSELAEHGLPIYFVNAMPQIVAETGKALPDALTCLPVVPLEKLADTVKELNLSVPVVTPESNRIRILAIEGETPVYFLVNESDKEYVGTITLPTEGNCYLYDPWFNSCHTADAKAVGKTTAVNLTVEPLKGIAVVFGDCDMPLTAQVRCKGEATEINEWKRSLCPGIAYPNFGESVLTHTPEELSTELPEFSGFVRYEAEIERSEASSVVLKITDAEECVEVFVNGQSLGIQVAAPFVYDLSAVLKDGKNDLVIEAATNLERQSYPLIGEFGRSIWHKPTAKTGITGNVFLYRE